MDKFDPVQIRYSGHEIRQLMELTARRAEMVQSVSLHLARGNLVWGSDFT